MCSLLVKREGRVDVFSRRGKAELMCSLLVKRDGRVDVFAREERKAELMCSLLMKRDGRVGPLFVWLLQTRSPVSSPQSRCGPPLACQLALVVVLGLVAGLLTPVSWRCW